MVKETCCEWCSTHFRRPFIHICAALQILACIAIINITYWQLDGLTVILPSGQTIDYTCALTTYGTSDSTCTYLYIACGVSIVVSIILMLSACFKCKCWAYTDIWVDWILTVIGTLWWCAAAIVLTAKVEEADDQNNVEEDNRLAVVIIAWILMVLFFLMYLLAQFRLCFKVCGCCGGKDYKRRLAEEKAAKDAEAKAQAAAATMPPVQQPPPADAVVVTPGAYPAVPPAGLVAVPAAAAAGAAAGAAVTSPGSQPSYVASPKDVEMGGAAVTGPSVTAPSATAPSAIAPTGTVPSTTAPTAAVPLATAPPVVEEKPKKKSIFSFMSK